MNSIIFIDPDCTKISSFPQEEGGFFVFILANMDRNNIKFHEAVHIQLTTGPFHSFVKTQLKGCKKAYLFMTSTDVDYSIMSSLRLHNELDELTFIKYNPKTEEWIVIPKLLVISDSAYQEKFSPNPNMWSFAWKRDGEEPLDVAFASFNIDNIGLEDDDLFEMARKIVSETAHRISKFQNVFVDLDPALSFLVMREIVQNPLLRGTQLWYPIFREGKIYPRRWKKVKFNE